MKIRACPITVVREAFLQQWMRKAQTQFFAGIGLSICLALLMRLVKYYLTGLKCEHTDWASSHTQPI